MPEQVPRSKMLDPWSLIHDPWSLIQSLIFDIWSLIHDPWVMNHDPWSLIIHGKPLLRGCHSGLVLVGPAVPVLVGCYPWNDPMLSVQKHTLWSKIIIPCFSCDHTFLNPWPIMAFVQPLGGAAKLGRTGFASLWLAISSVGNTLHPRKLHVNSA